MKAAVIPIVLHYASVDPLGAGRAGGDLPALLDAGPAANGGFLSHITSTRFDEPMARALVARSEYCITVHGAAGAGELVFLGGLHEELKALLRDRLTEAGFEPAESSDPELQGPIPSTSVTEARRAPASSWRSRADYEMR